MTVVRGLAPSARAELVGVLAGIPAGRAPVSGLIEAHGVLLDLDATNLDLLDLDADSAVGVVARALPCAPPPGRPPASRPSSRAPGCLTPPGWRRLAPRRATRIRPSPSPRPRSSGPRRA